MQFIKNKKSGPSFFTQMQTNFEITGNYESNPNRFIILDESTPITADASNESLSIGLYEETYQLYGGWKFTIDALVYTKTQDIEKIAFAATNNRNDNLTLPQSPYIFSPTNFTVHFLVFLSTDLQQVKAAYELPSQVVAMEGDSFGNTYIITKAMDSGSYTVFKNVTTQTNPWVILAKFDNYGSLSWYKKIELNGNAESITPKLTVQTQTGLRILIFSNSPGVVYIMVQVEQSVTIGGIIANTESDKGILGWAFLPNGTTFFWELFLADNAEIQLLQFSGEMIMLGGKYYH
jgi:hypothetical protein